MKQINVKKYTELHRPLVALQFFLFDYLTDNNLDSFENNKKVTNWIIESNKSYHALLNELGISYHEDQK